VDACRAGNGQDTILVPTGTYVLSICGDREEGNQTGDLDILDDLTLIGAGPGITILDGASDICGKEGPRKCRRRDESDRVLDVHPGVTADISSVTITHGRVCKSHSSEEIGGGVRNRGELTLHDSDIEDTEVVGAPEALQDFVGTGDGVANVAYAENATMTLNSCHITNNTSAGGGGVSNISRSPSSTACSGATARRRGPRAAPMTTSDTGSPPSPRRATTWKTSICATSISRSTRKPGRRVQKC
jgi:hypothetical protein